jgi:hypothetical protein
LIVNTINGTSIEDTSMKTLTINEFEGQQIVLFNNQNAFGDVRKAKTLIACPLGGATWLTPDNLLKVRNWIDDRLQELLAQGLLTDTEG